jgi:hypothetical protein
MKASAWLFAAAMSVSSFALAQNALPPGVTQITDPAKIAEIERHAQQLASGQPTTSMKEERHHMRDGKRHHKHGMRHHGKKHGMRHHKNKAMHKDAMKDKAPSDTPMATESKN